MSAITIHAALADLLEFAEANDLVPEEVLCAGWEYADTLARAASKRSGTKSKRQILNEHLLEVLLEKAAELCELGPNFTVADAMSRVRPLGGVWADMSVQKMTALITMAVKAGRLTKARAEGGRVVYTVNA